MHGGPTFRHRSQLSLDANLFPKSILPFYRSVRGADCSWRVLTRPKLNLVSGALLDLENRLDVSPLYKRGGRKNTKTLF
jgi:hypothetical protein